MFCYISNIKIGSYFLKPFTSTYTNSFPLLMIFNNTVIAKRKNIHVYDKFLRVQDKCKLAGKSLLSLVI